MAEQGLRNTPPTQASDHPTTDSPTGSVTSYQVAKFQKQLQSFMQQPMDSLIEQQFAAAILPMKFYVPVQMTIQTATPKQPTERLGMAMATITYLADGQQYVPVFTEESALQSFLVNQLTNLNLRTIQLTADEVMLEAGSLKTSGILINPGQQNFPLANDYWRYIHQVMPLVPERAQDYQLQLITPTPVKMQGAMRKTLRHAHHVKAAWLIDLKLPEESHYETALIVDYQGMTNQFQDQIAPKLAIAGHRYQEYGTDLLVGTTREAVGLAVSQMLAPFYKRHHSWWE